MELIGLEEGDGSSPRGRGKRRNVRRPLRNAGLIPARAGKTTGRAVCRSAPWAHPRAGGENLSVDQVVGGLGGSSPRGRGKLGRGLDVHCSVRLIPARAGKTGIPRPGRRGRPGSSPRGRGKRRQVHPAHQGTRLIPARAGKTRRPASAAICLTAHPRAGGENQQAYQSRARDIGSSPRGRGKRAGCRGSACPRGLIPARAGKTLMQSRVGVVSVGSSPRGRGKHLQMELSAVGDGLIPARAGKTRHIKVDRASLRAHPRAGGENCVIWGTTNDPVGSSPRGRGKREHPHQVPESVRLIPARAGKT